MEKLKNYCAREMETILAEYSSCTARLIRCAKYDLSPYDKNLKFQAFTLEIV